MSSPEPSNSQQPEVASSKIDDDHEPTTIAAIDIKEEPIISDAIVTKESNKSLEAGLETILRQAENMSHCLSAGDAEPASGFWSLQMNINSVADVLRKEC